MGKKKILAISSAVIVGVSAIAAVVAVVVFGLLPSGDGNEYLRVIPDNPLVLAKINAGSLLEKSEALENRNVQKGINILRQNLDGNLREAFDKIIEDPVNSGIDIRKPIFVAVTDAWNEEGLVTMAVDDVDNLKRYFELIFSEGGMSLKEEDGVYSVIDPYGEVIWQVAFDSDKLVFAFCKSDIANAHLYVLDEKSPKAVDNAKYADVFAAEEDIVLFLNASVFLPQIDARIAAEEDLVTVLNGTDIRFTADFRKGEFVVDADVDAHEELARVFTGLIRKGSGKHLAYVPYNAWLVANLSLDLDALEQTISKMVNLEALMMLYGVERSMVDALSTEYTVAMLPGEQVYGDYVPRFVLVADCTRELFDFIVEQMRMYNAISTVAADVYSIGADYLLYKDGLLILLPENIYREQMTGAGLERSILDNKEMALKDGAAAVLDVHRFLKENCMMGNAGNNGMRVVEILTRDNVGTVTLSLESLFDFTLRMNMVDSSENALKSFFDRYMEQAGIELPE